MEKLSKIVTPLLLIAIFVTVILKSDFRFSASHPDQSIRLSIDSLKTAIEARDTIIIPRDSVVYRTNKILREIHEYHTETDTVEKLIRCDSIISDCDTIVRQYAYQDSVFRVQISDMGKVIAKQDTVIQAQDKTMRRQRRVNAVLTGVGATLAGLVIIR